jgi:hypothetical protein
LNLKTKGSKKRLFTNRGGIRLPPSHKRTERKISFDAVRKMALALPEVEEGTTYGSPALKVRGKLLACIAIHKSAEPDTLAVRIPFDSRDELIASDPDSYYLTYHYVNYPTVLVRLSRVDAKALRELLDASWIFVSGKNK